MDYRPQGIAPASPLQAANSENPGHFDSIAAHKVIDLIDLPEYSYHHVAVLHSLVGMVRWKCSTMRPDVGGRDLEEIQIGECWGSHEALADRARMPVSTYRRALNDLVRWGLVVVWHARPKLPVSIRITLGDAPLSQQSKALAPTSEAQSRQGEPNAPQGEPNAPQEQQNISESKVRASGTGEGGSRARGAHTHVPPRAYESAPTEPSADPTPPTSRSAAAETPELGVVVDWSEVAMVAAAPAPQPEPSAPPAGIGGAPVEQACSVPTVAPTSTPAPPPAQAQTTLAVVPSEPPARPRRTRRTRSTAPATAEEIGAVDRAWEAYLAGRSRIGLTSHPPVRTADRTALAVDRLRDGVTAETLVAAASGIWRSEWHLRKKQTRWELVYRDVEHVETCADFAAEQPEVAGASQVSDIIARGLAHWAQSRAESGLGDYVSQPSDPQAMSALIQAANRVFAERGPSTTPKGQLRQPTGLVKWWIHVYLDDRRVAGQSEYKTARNVEQERYPLSWLPSRLTAIGLPPRWWPPAEKHTGT